MTLVAFALIGGWAGSLIAAFQLLRSERRQHARERDLLLNQLLHAVGKPWNPAPADDRTPVEIVSRPYMVAPEQQPFFN